MRRKEGKKLAASLDCNACAELSKRWGRHSHFRRRLPRFRVRGCCRLGGIADTSAGALGTGFRKLPLPPPPLLLGDRGFGRVGASHRCAGPEQESLVRPVSAASGRAEGSPPKGPRAAHQEPFRAGSPPRPCFTLGVRGLVCLRVSKEPPPGSQEDYIADLTLPPPPGVTLGQNAVTRKLILCHIYIYVYIYEIL